ncbi:hypothetical protein GTGU_04366 [Trabulsiella guamensis ATCC 49490]|uniref:Novel toxin 21 domain-containing protein n=1 Tax=Trabulsiella guamensis ATCC 49490 TaxID=1005994 RepID=A0A084ZMK2_9ENTR|nr:toxin C-terminal domain-containing protein [Trabulsiella guamensis]KFB98696.1 hypothetical protein GTGU_04366 [Trabulsiella guamensis ATCC 49490]
MTSPLQSASERVVSDNNALAIVAAGNSAAAAGSGAVAGAVGQGSQYQVNNTTDDLDIAGSCEGTREQCAVRDPSRDGTRGPGHTELPIAEQDPTGGKLVNPDQSGEQGLTHTGNNQPSGQSVTNTGDPGGNPDTGGNTTVTPIPEGPSKDDLAYLALKGKEAQEAAKNLGFDRRIPQQKAPFNSHGQPVYSDGKNYITPDIDSHNVTNGWKMFDRKGNRIGTYDSNLTGLRINICLVFFLIRIWCILMANLHHLHLLLSMNSQK